jgi:hypothetical protein
MGDPLKWELVGLAFKDLEAFPALPRMGFLLVGGRAGKSFPLGLP